MKEGRREKQVGTATGGMLARLLKRLPAIRAQRRAARRLAATLSRYEGPLELPDEATIHGWIEGLCATPHRRPGSPEGRRGEEWVAERFREIGLEAVTTDSMPLTVWSADRWSLTVAGAEVPSFYVVNTGFTPGCGIRAPLAWVGTGTEADFARVDVSGRIAVADVTFPQLPVGLLMRVMGACYALSDPDGAVALSTRQYLNFARRNFAGGRTAADDPASDVYWQAVRRGAKAICLILRDQPSNANTHYGPYDGIMKPIPGLWVGKLDGTRLREQARAGAAAELSLHGRATPGETRNVWAVLLGATEETVFVTSHHDSPFKGAVEDGAGVAQVLAQAQAWARVARERRRRTMVFVVDAGHFYGSLGAHAFARAHGDLLRKARLLLALEHLGAKEVREDGAAYAETGRLALTVMFTTPEPRVIATVLRALETKPARVTAAIPSDFFGPVPTSDAAGYVREAGVPVVSWIGCPYYLLDEHDTLDKIDRAALRPIAETAAEILRVPMGGG